MNQPGTWSHIAGMWPEARCLTPQGYEGWTTDTVLVTPTSRHPILKAPCSASLLCSRWANKSQGVRTSQAALTMQDERGFCSPPPPWFSDSESSPQLCTTRIKYGTSSPVFLSIDNVASLHLYREKGWQMGVYVVCSRSQNLHHLNQMQCESRAQAVCCISCGKTTFN